MPTCICALFPLINPLEQMSNIVWAFCVVGTSFFLCQVGRKKKNYKHLFLPILGECFVNLRYAWLNVLVFPTKNMVIDLKTRWQCAAPTPFAPLLRRSTPVPHPAHRRLCFDKGSMLFQFGGRSLRKNINQFDILKFSNLNLFVTGFRA